MCVWLGSVHIIYKSQNIKTSSLLLISWKFHYRDNLYPTAPDWHLLHWIHYTLSMGDYQICTKKCERSNVKGQEKKGNLILIVSNLNVQWLAWVWSTELARPFWHFSVPSCFLCLFVVVVVIVVVSQCVIHHMLHKTWLKTLEISVCVTFNGKYGRKWEISGSQGAFSPVWECY